MLVLIKSVVNDSQPLGLDVVNDITGVGLTVTVTATVGVSVIGQLGSDNVNCIFSCGNTGNGCICSVW